MEIENKKDKKVLTEEEKKYDEKRNEKVKGLREFYGEEFDSPGNGHLHPCYNCYYDCNCKKKVLETLGVARSCMSVGYW